jgi:hypothetical protein
MRKRREGGEAFRDLHPPRAFQPGVRGVAGVYFVPFGVWRSPVARLLWEQEVPGSNPGAPTGVTGGDRKA